MGMKKPPPPKSKPKPAKGKRPAKPAKAKRSQSAPPLPVKLALPVPVAGDVFAELPPEIVIEPIPVSHAEVKPLPVAVQTRCVLTMREKFFGGEYIVLSAAPGHVLPKGLKTGLIVNVEFAPL